MSTKQSVTHEKAGELHSLEISEGLLQEISIDIIGHYSGYHKPIYKDDPTKGDSDKHIFRRDSQDLYRQHLEAIWNTKEDLQ